MGNHATKPVASEPSTINDNQEDAPPKLPASVSSTSLSSDSEEDDNTMNDDGNPTTKMNNKVAHTPAVVDGDHDDDENSPMGCTRSSRSPACIPSVLSLYRKEGPLIIPSCSDNDGKRRVKEDSGDDDDDDYGSVDEENENSTNSKTGTGANNFLSSRISSRSCSAGRQRRRSWSPKANRKMNFLFSKYHTSSSSTTSLSSLLAKTKQQWMATTSTTASSTSASSTTTTITNSRKSRYTEEELAMVDGDLPTHESDLNRLRDYFIVTTAALPWMTGTAVNPLLRAASLSRHQRQQFAPNRSTVTLVVPWLEVAQDRIELYGDDWKDKTQADQEAYIRDWLSTRAGMPEEAKLPSKGGIRILFYPARYHSDFSSIFAMGDLCEFIVSPQQHNLTIHSDDAVCVLEEPEHVHFYRAQHWRDHFSFVCGVVHTNYRAYAASATLAGSFITGPLVGTISSWLVRAYCDKVIKLSPVLQSFDCPEKEVVCNVHGIRQEFIQEGKRRALLENNQNEPAPKNGIYFIGKLLWAKGLDKLLELEALYRSITGDYFPIDIYGSGPEQDDIEQAYLSEWPRFLGGGQSFSGSGELEEFSSPSTTPESGPTNNNSNNNRRGLARTYYSTFIRPKPPVPARFLGRKDHAELTGDYKIFVNPSITEVLCTTTAEATAMGKFVIIPDHPSNAFFHQFPNCLLYKSRAEFVDFLQYAVQHNPEPLADDLIHQLTWEAATERFIQASAISRRDAKWRERVGKTKSDEKIAKMHYELGKGAKGDVLRKVLGGGPVADQFQYDCRMLQHQSSCAEESSASVSETSANQLTTDQHREMGTPVAVI